MKKHYPSFESCPAPALPARWLLGACLALLTVFSAKADTTVFQQIIDNVVSRELATTGISSAVSSTRSYMSSIQSDGSWSDIEYSSTAQTNWAPITHLDRLKAMAVAYIADGSSLKGDTTLYNDIVNGLNYWYTKKPTSTNWYMYEIGWPQRMGVILCLLRHGEKQVPASTEKNILTWQKSISKGPNQSGSQGTGANKMDIALQWIYRTALQEDKTNLDFAVNQFFLPIKFNSGEGLQTDYSYLQHGMQLYAGGYGGSVLTATIKVVYYLEGTSYAEQGDYMNYISNFVRLGYLPSVRGQYMSFNNVGRSVANKSGMSRTSFASITTALEQLDPSNATAFHNATQRLQGKAAASYGIDDFHRHYWRADYTVHQRAGYNIDVRTASTRTLRCENGNGANLKGYFMTEGGTWISQSGTEYADLPVAWDWAHLPGTTVPAVSSIPQPSQWGTSGQSTFTGGVSDGLYGAMTYKMNNTEYSINTQANKSWFFFDNEVVCMGAGIKSSNSSNVHTTINQCLLNGDVVTETSAGTGDTLSTGTHSSLADVAWVNHDNITYHFPAGGSLKINNTTQSGTWKSIDSANSDTNTYTKNVFKMWLDHGNKPSAASYVYYIVPNTQNIAAAKEKTDSLTLVNTDSVQAVYNHTLNMVQAIFYKAAKLTVGNVEVSATAPCAAMFANVNTSSVKAYVSDPSYSLDSLTLYAKFPALAYKQLGCKLNTASMYSGSTSEFVIDENTADSVFIPVEQVALSSSGLTLSGSSMYATLTASVLPSNATEQGVTWSSSNTNIVKVDQSGNVLAVRSGKADVTVTAENGVQSVCHVTVEDGMATAYTTADAYVYDGASTTNYGKATTLVVRKDGSKYCRGVYARFPLSALDSLSSTDASRKVKLVFYVNYGAEKVTEVKWTVHSLKTDTWDESTVTWSNGPSTLATLTSKSCFIPTSVWKNNYVEFDITSYALQQYAAGATDLSVYIYQSARATGGKGTSQFASRENGNALYTPRLVVTGEEIPAGIHTATVSEGDLKASFSNGGLSITATSAAEAVLYDIQGAAVGRYSLPSAGTHTYSADGLPHGVYLLRAGKQTVKLMK